MLSFRFANEFDVDLLYKWANDELSRKNSYNQEPIEYQTHVSWFTKRVNDNKFSFYIFSNEQKNDIGQVRVEKDSKKKEAFISISIDRDHRGKGYSSKMLQIASIDFIRTNQGFIIIAQIFKTNRASYKSFLKACYKQTDEQIINGIPSFVLVYNQI